MSELTSEQLARIERNRLAAIEKRAAKFGHPSSSTSQQHNPQVHTTDSFYTKNCSATSTGTGLQSSSSIWQSNKTHTLPPNPGRGVSSHTDTSSLSRSANSLDKFSTSTVVAPTLGSLRRTGQCIMISEERFKATITFHKPSVDIFKTMKSALYDSETKTWSFALEDYDRLMYAMKHVTSELTLGGLPPIILKTFRNNHTKISRIPDVDLSRIDKALVTSLMPFQREGICFGISKQGRCLIADDMGLGKTIQALGIAHYYQEDWPLLIVSPSSVRYLWEEAIMNWLPSVPMHHIVVMTTGKDYIDEAKILIVSYDLLSRYAQEMSRLKCGAIILDECHFMKNFKSERTKAALKLIKSMKRVILLSGTPALSRPIELYPQLVAIDPKNVPSLQDFGIRYCAGKTSRFGWDYSGSSNMEELQLLLTSRYMIRRMKSDVITQLPAKRRQVVILCPDKVSSSSKEMKKHVTMLESKDLKGMARRGKLMEYYNSTGIAKLKAVQDYVTNILESGQKFICFAHHKAVLDGICCTIESKKLKHIRIDGSTNPKIRQQLCDSFQEDRNVVAAVLSITAANAGITLTAAHLVVFAELFWNPGILMQAEDRAHRIGQQDSVVIRYLVAKGTADDHLWPLINRKLVVLNQVGLSKDNFVNNESIYLKDSKQKTMESYFEVIVDDLLSDEADNWLAEVNLDFDISVPVPEKKQKLS